MHWIKRQELDRNCAQQDSRKQQTLLNRTLLDDNRPARLMPLSRCKQCWRISQPVYRRQLQTLGLGRQMPRTHCRQCLPTKVCNLQALDSVWRQVSNWRISVTLDSVRLKTFSLTSSSKALCSKLYSSNSLMRLSSNTQAIRALEMNHCKT